MDNMDVTFSGYGTCQNCDKVCCEVFNVTDENDITLPWCAECITRAFNEMMRDMIRAAESMR
jgi:hypothetical protein